MGLPETLRVGVGVGMEGLGVVLGAGVADIVASCVGPGVGVRATKSWARVTFRISL